jgi:glycosyltransferase involved in cell wall biosynthesis
MNNNKTKILFIIETFGIGGREKIVAALANGLSNLNYEVTVLCMSNNVIDLKEELNKKVCFYTLPFSYRQIRGAPAIFFWIRGLPKYVKLINEIKPQIIHTHVFFQHFLFAAIGIKKSGLKIFHFHTIHMNGLFYVDKSAINRFRLQSEKFAVYIAKPYLVAIAETVFAMCNKHFKKNAADIQCIHNGIDKAKFNFNLRSIVNKKEFGFRSEDIIITYVARMDAGKDHITLLRAWQKVTSFNSNARLLLAGNGELKTELLKFASENNLDSSVFFLDAVSNVNELLAITDIGVFTSLYEGFSVALIEKMFMKLPMVASSIPAIKLLITDSVNGFLFEPGDFKKLSELLITLINDAPLRLQMGEAAYNSVQDYSLENMVIKHNSYYNHAIKTHWI